MLQYLKTKLTRNEDGVTAIEYGLLAALIAVVIIGGATMLGGEIDSKFSDIATEVQKAGTTNEGTETP